MTQPPRPGPTMAELDLAARDLAETEGLSYERAMVRLQQDQIQAVQAAQWDRNHPPVYGPPAPRPGPHTPDEFTLQLQAVINAGTRAAQALQASLEQIHRILSEHGLPLPDDQEARPRHPYRTGATMKPRDLKKPPRDLGATSRPPPPPRRPRP